MRHSLGQALLIDCPKDCVVNSCSPTFIATVFSLIDEIL